MAELLQTPPVRELVGNDDKVEQALTHLFEKVGDRVRKGRENKGISRRVLSECSGVSPRYLAQLEAGAGNISIGLLKRIAIALDTRIEWLVGEDDRSDPNTRHFLQLLKTASPAAKEAAIRLLEDDTAGQDRAKRICLLGLRGAGKSTLGRLVAERLQMPFIELNREIESSAGMQVGDIISLYGPDGYRQLESSELNKVIDAHSDVVLAAGGGLVTEAATYSNLLSHFHTVWVKASPQEHMNRVREQGDERPMEGNPRAMDQLKMILRAREGLYKKANATLDTSGKSIDQTVDELASIIRAHQFLD